MKRFTLLLGIWITVVVTMVTVRLFLVENPPEISGGTATAYGMLLGLPPIIFGLIKWARGGDK